MKTFPGRETGPVRRGLALSGAGTGSSITARQQLRRQLVCSAPHEVRPRRLAPRGSRPPCDGPAGHPEPAGTPKNWMVRWEHRHAAAQRRDRRAGEAAPVLPPKRAFKGSGKGAEELPALGPRPQLGAHLPQHGRHLLLAAAAPLPQRLQRHGRQQPSPTPTPTPHPGPARPAATRP